ncbi:MAG: membrane integrity-associated transporter subunit PqiC [Alphaproteobacteria bacterium]|nr:MAG: membrane integrity-associated transporter subunit PqiC [Alphaproteobacteria bacterium]
MRDLTMKRRLFLPACGVALGLLALTGCSSPDPSFYTLAPIRGTPIPGGPKLVELRRPGIAGYLDRSEIARSNSPYQLKLNSAERWGEPFGDMLGRVLAEDLNSRLAGTSVFTSAGAISADAGARVEIDIQRFDADAGGQIVLVAQVAITRDRNRSEPITSSLRLSETPASGSTADYVAAMSRALAAASERIASDIRRVSGDVAS